MSKKSFNILAVCTALAVAAAFWAIQQEWSRWGTSEYGTKFFPELAGNLDDVARVRVLRGGTHITLERSPKGWAVAESDGYPAHAKAIQELLYALSEARRLEPKTHDPKKFAKLQVEDPGQAASEAKQIDVFDKAGRNIASLILGKENLLLQAIGEGGAYVRLPGQEQSWLASGNLIAGPEFKDWLDNPVLDIPRRRIASAVITHPNGDRLVVVKSGTSDDAFAVEGMEADEKLISEYYPTDIGRALEKFEVHQVRRREAIPFPAEATVKGEYHTADGLTVTFELAMIDGKDWIRFNAAGGQTPEAAAEGKKLMSRLEDWTFQIPEFESIHVKKTRSQVVEKTKPQS
jgi:hypothetical protein